MRRPQNRLDCHSDILRNNAEREKATGLICFEASAESHFDFNLIESSNSAAESQTYRRAELLILVPVAIASTSMPPIALSRKNASREYVLTIHHSSLNRSATLTARLAAARPAPFCSHASLALSSPWTLLPPSAKSEMPRIFRQGISRVRHTIPI
jgi:hypothetical protein